MTENKQDWRQVLSHHTEGYIHPDCTQTAVEAEIAAAVAKERERASILVTIAKKAMQAIELIVIISDRLGHPDRAKDFTEILADYRAALKNYKEGK